MFDDPGRKLRWMEAELLAEENEGSDEIFEAFDKEFDDLMDQADSFLEEAEREEDPVLSRKFAFSHHKKQPMMDSSRVVYGDEEIYEEKAVWVEKKKRNKQPKEKAAVNRNIKGLVILAFLEVCGILAIVGWWLRWLI